MGALRFKINMEKDFVAKTNVERINARELEEISRLYENAELNIQSSEFTKQLLSPGSSLGGARPKASIKMPEGDL